MRAGGLFAVAFLVLSTCACTNVAVPTCDEYAAMSSSEQSKLLSSMLRSHGLDGYAAVNVAGITLAISDHCGAGVLLGSSATSNNASPIDDDIDWSSDTW